MRGRLKEWSADARLAGIRAACRAFSLLGPARGRAGDVQGVVVTLHHVRPAGPRGFDPNAGLSVTPDFLDRFLAAFGEDGWRFVPLDELVTDARKSGDARRIAITLDDGYRDNAEHALPVSLRRAAPFTIFVTPGFCDATAELWWEALERIVAGSEALAPVAGMGPPALPARTIAEKRIAYRAWLEWLTREADEAAQRVAIRALADRHGLDLAALARSLVMPWDLVREVAREPLCTIGAHTLTHPALARLEAGAALEEMRGSADRIEREIGVRPQTIAFPYGYPAAAGAREAALAEQAGFKASFTTRPGLVLRGANRHGLPRISLNGHMQDVGATRGLLSPALWKLGGHLSRWKNRVSGRREGGRAAASN